MPQMMPLNWLYLYMLFFITYMIFLMLIYYTPMHPSLTVSATTLNKNFNKNTTIYWKW